MSRLSPGISIPQIFLQHDTARDHQAEGSHAYAYCKNNEQTPRLVDEQVTQDLCIAHAHFWVLRLLVLSISPFLVLTAFPTLVLNCSEEFVSCSNSCALNARTFAEWPWLTRTVAVRRLSPIKAISPK